MNLFRRKFLHLAAGAAALPAIARIALAQAYPSQPVRIIVGFAAGGASDIIARIMGQWLSDQLAKPFVIENRSGAGTSIATEAVARAPADGYTLLLVNSSGAINAAFYGDLRLNVVRDIAPVASISREADVIVVHPSVPATTVPEFIAYAKANPGKINMASSSNGTSAHMAGELFNMMAGLNLVHVPYRGGAPALADMLGGHVQIMFPAISSAIEYVRSSKLRVLAVTTGNRQDVLPDTPTVAEFVPGYEASVFVGIGAPRNTPTASCREIAAAVRAALALRRHVRDARSACRSWRGRRAARCSCALSLAHMPRRANGK